MICDFAELESVKYSSGESLLKVNQLYGNVWEFTKNDNTKEVICKGGDNKVPSFVMNNELSLKILKNQRNFSIGIRLEY